MLVFIVVGGIIFLLLRLQLERVQIRGEIATCAQAGAQARNCYRDLISQAVRILPFRDAQAVFTQIANDTHQECHDLAHVFGRMTFLKTGKLPSNIDEQSLYLCANGFWHGFMTAYAWEHKDAPQDIVTLCSGHPEVNNFELNCYHGVGIGSVGDPPDVTIWGNESHMITRAIDACRAIAPTDNTRLECVSGVFHEIIIDKLAGAFGFPYFNISDPMEFCEGQEKEYKYICVGQMASQVHIFAKGDPAEFMKLLAGHIEDKTFLLKAFSLSVQGFVSSMQEENIASVFVSCQALLPEDRAACVYGATAGYLARGVPSGQIERVFNLCRGLEEVDKNVCTKQIVQFADDNNACARSHAYCD